MKKETPLPTQRRRRVSWMLGAPLIAVGAVAFILVVTRPLGGGEPQPSFFVIASAVPGVQIGQIAPGTAEAPPSPQLSLTDLGGAPMELRDFAGQPVWIVFWKTACEPCEAEAADVAAAYAAHQAEGLIILGIDLWDSAAVVRDDTSSDRGFPIAVDPTGDFMDAYGVWGAPTHYFLDSAGIIQDRYFGPMTRDLIEESLRKIVSP